jgi:hypothetical protein
MEVFRAGDYGAKGVWSEADLDQLARDYSPQLLEAPLTFDHARSGPAFGWVRALRKIGDRLVAVVGDVPAVVRELVRRGAYRKRSVEILRHFAPTGRPYLRAVSLLGAATPAVPGLREVSFEAHEEPLCFQDDAELLELRATVSRLEAELASLRAERHRATAERLVALARESGAGLNPREAELVEAFCLAFGEAPEIVRFGEKEMSPLEWLEQMLTARSPQVPEVPARPVAFAQGSASGCDDLAWGDQVDPMSVALHRKTMALRASRPGLSYASALIAAARGADRSEPAHPISH